MIVSTRLSERVAVAIDQNLMSLALYAEHSEGGQAFATAFMATDESAGNAVLVVLGKPGIVGRVAERVKLVLGEVAERMGEGSGADC